MEKNRFETALRNFIRREPFTPFVVELTNGETVHVEEPSVAFNDGYAGYFSPDYEIIEFDCADVRDIRPANKEPAQ